MKTFFCNSILMLLVSPSFCFVLSDQLDKQELMKRDDTEQKAEACICPKHPKPMDCGEVQENGNTESGIYTIWPRGREKNCQTLEVYCDMVTAGGGWTVIQRRGQFCNAVDYFSKDWKTYKEGFGVLKKEFWLGNENIHILTNQAQYSVRMDLKKDNVTSGFTVYESFWIDDESENYKLHLSDASGSAGNSIWDHNGRAFYTRDRPNKEPGRPKDEKQREGGWWYNVRPSSNLNALNLYGITGDEAEDGITWFDFAGSHYSLRATEIKVRSKNH